MLGSFLSVLVLFIIPVTLMGTISPFAIRLAIPSKDEAGKTSGRIYAISTLGSILGTFLPVLVLIPWIGTSFTFMALSLLLLLVGLIGMFKADRKAAPRYAVLPLILVLLSWLVLAGPLKSDPGQVFEDESQYNYIQVVENEGVRFLLLNEGQAVHSVYNPNGLATFGTWDYFLAAPFFYPESTEPSQLERVGIVGLAAGTISKQYTQVFGPVPIDGWEIDPRIIEVGQEYFDMTEPNLNPIAADGRLGLERSRHQYSVIAVDAYRPPYIPWHLTTQEFFELVKSRLTEDGSLVINVGRTPDDRRLIEAMVGTLMTVFPSVHVVDVPFTFNSIVYATVQPTQAGNLRSNLESLAGGTASPFLLDVLSRAADNLQPTPQADIVFTDDRAPIERLVNSIVLRYMIGDARQFLPEVLQ
jgi:spermidine synthase